MKKKTIHFWVPYPVRSAPSQRFRVEQYLPYLPNDKVSYVVFSFLDKQAWSVFYEQGQRLKRILGIIRGYLRRIAHLSKSIQADYVFILREASPLGPPVFEWLLAKLFRKKIIYDFDDAIWIPGGERYTWRKRFFKSTWKVKYIIRWAYRVSCGNEFLYRYAINFNQNVVILPTVFDTERSRLKHKNAKEGERIIVGWTGSHTTLHNLEEIQQVIKELKKEIEFDFFIISNKPPGWDFDFIFKKWEEATEIEDLLKVDIGVMPLKKGPWFEGKCGFKLIQYFACGIPAVASPVGVNSIIVSHGQNGYIAQTPEEWKQYLKILISDRNRRTQMGESGRSHIISEYSLKRYAGEFIKLFE